ncbi:MAG: class I SAM-dependent methyltransferase [Dehalococcoidia bacterium]|jgi:ubiquinone/menaquinone biosynthesis C-methylase UbiE
MPQEPTWLYFPEWLKNDTWHFPYAYSTFRKHIPKDSHVLEVGFGSGRILTKIARELNCRCVGVDIPDHAFPTIAFFCQQEGVHVEALKGDGFALPFKDGSFEVVYSEGVIEHFPIERSVQMLKEHVRVCKPGGIVIVSVPNKFALFHSLTKRLLGPRFLFYPEASYSNKQLAKFMKQAGLSLIARDGFAFGCQFYMFQAFYLEETFPKASKSTGKIGLGILNILKKMHLYHFDNPQLNAMIGFQTMAVGRKITLPG